MQEKSGWVGRSDEHIGYRRLAESVVGFIEQISSFYFANLMFCMTERLYRLNEADVRTNAL